MSNSSNNEMDKRVIAKILMEKAMLGYVPVAFRIEGDERTHPCDWSRHPHLREVLFSDGSPTQVVAAAVTEEFAKKVGPVPEPRVVYLDKEELTVDSEPTQQESEPTDPDIKAIAERFAATQES